MCASIQRKCNYLAPFFVLSPVTFLFGELLMKKSRVLLLFLIVCAAGASTWFIASNDLIGKFFNEDDPDRPAMGDKPPLDEYLLRRNEHMDLLRGYDTAQQDSRTNSILEMEQSEQALE